MVGYERASRIHGATFPQRKSDLFNVGRIWLPDTVTVWCRRQDLHRQEHLAARDVQDVAHFATDV